MTEAAYGFTIEVTHASVTRPGLATPHDLRVTTEDGSPLIVREGRPLEES